MRSDDPNLKFAVGYLELGMLDDAVHAIESISPQDKNSSSVLAVRMEIYRASKNWSLMEVVARELWRRHQDESLHWINLAWATRRSADLKEAHRILGEALERFPDDATTHFNLGCYECQLGDLESAKARVGQAIKLDPKFGMIALDDPDLEPMWVAWSW